MQPLTTEHLELAFLAWAIAQQGHDGMVLEGDAYPAAHQLAEAGWLERYFRDDTLCWRWAPTADTALQLGELMTSAVGREN